MYASASLRVRKGEEDNIGGKGGGEERVGKECEGRLAEEERNWVKGWVISIVVAWEGGRRIGELIGSV